jgi:hypothetical protein
MDDEFNLFSNNQFVRKDPKVGDPICNDFVEEVVNQRNSRKVEQRCGSNTFDQDSAVDEPLVAAEYNDMNKNHIGKQSQGDERNIISVHGTRCLNQEIVQFHESKEVSSFPIIQFTEESPKKP